MFYVRVLSGYEERRIRNYRLQLQNSLQQVQEKKAALRRIPERVILDEVRSMVELMQTLNRKLDEAIPAPDAFFCFLNISILEAAIEYFKPLDKEAERIVKMQLEGEDRSMKEMMTAMQKPCSRKLKLRRLQYASSGHKPN